ncbi:MAG: response regulator transcription factor [Deltaproteobacteria bacterium]|nr:response regulator transcription factor [Deltaproteobacteria bacterium]
MTANQPIRVLIADDSQLARLGIAALIETSADMTLVAQACDGASAIELYRQWLPDVLLVDLKMPGIDGVQVVATLAKETPPAKTIVVSQFEGDEGVFRALRAGALSYVTKDAQGSDILAAIRSAAAGKRFLPGNIGAKLADRVTGELLSLRELQVLKLLADGLSNLAIAKSLSLSERTVAVHVAHILEKMGVKNRAQAVASAMKRGILP